MSNTIPVPLKEHEGEKWLLLSAVTSDKGVVRAAQINKAKNPVQDWDKHHCDEATVRGSIRFKPKSWDI